MGPLKGHRDDRDEFYIVKHYLLSINPIPHCVSKPKVMQHAKFGKNADVNKKTGFFSEFFFY